MTANKTILLVDDNPDDRFFHRLEIEKSGFATQIYECIDGQDALDFLTGEGKYLAPDQPITLPDLIFLDINMPVMDGWEFLNAFQGLSERLSRIPIVVLMLTKLNQNENTRALSYPHVKAFYCKPLDKGKLDELIPLIA